MASGTAHWDYRAFLRQELAAKRLSMAAVATQAGVSAPFLSQVLNGRRGLSEGRAATVAEHLRFDETKSRYFVTMVRYGNARSPALRRALGSELRTLDEEAAKTKAIDQDVFAAISQYHHGAILELTRLDEFKPSTPWIARRLGIEPLAAEMAVNRLLRLGLLKASGSTWVATDEHVTSGNVPSKAVRRYHAQMMTLATKALETQPFDQRDARGKTFAVARSQLPELRRLIDQLFRGVTSRGTKARQDAVYHLSVQLFRLDHGEL